MCIGAKLTDRDNYEIKLRIIIYRFRLYRHRSCLVLGTAARHINFFIFAPLSHFIVEYVYEYYVCLQSKYRL